jgi:tetratricopeptide (TPR) repeat protein
MPYVEGESLRQRLVRERQLPITEALRITLDVSQALEYAHQHGILHRDIKPENLLLTMDGSALVADFGLARALGVMTSEDLTGTGLAVGTPAYMSPEQAGGAKDLDSRTDIYSLGCVLYEMLAGDPPFSGRSAAAILARKSVEAVPSLRVVRESVPEHLENVVLQALAKVPADRFATMHAFAAALEAVVGEMPRATKPTGLRARRASRPIVVLIAGVVVTSGLTVWGLTRSDGELVTERIAVSGFENRTGDPSLDPLGSMAADWLTDGILRGGFAEVVPTTATLLILSSPPVRDSSSRGAAAVHHLAEETGAGTIVSGSYYRIRDSLRFQAYVVDAQRDKLLRVVAPVAGPADQPVQLIEMLRQRVLGALVLHFDTTAESFGILNSPPTYAAYKRYLEALRLSSQLRFAEAIPHLDSAFALDSTFLSALVVKAWAHTTLGEFTIFDSLDQILESERERLSPREAFDLDWLKATRRGDLQGARRALQQQVALTPDPGTKYSEAVFALRTNHPREAISGLTRRDRESIFWRMWPWTWQVPTEAYHLLSKHKEELKEARHGREQHRDLPVTMHFEILARAALGQVPEVHSLLDEALQLGPQPVWTYGSLAAEAALELRAHGRADSAHRVMQRAIDWYRDRLGEDPEQVDTRFGLAQCLYWADLWSEARELLSRLIAEIPEEGVPWRGVGTATDFDYLGLSGAVAARQGHPDEALRISEKLAAIKHPNLLFGQPTLWRARIAALLGDHDLAVDLLREAISQGLMPLDLAQGLGYAMWLHRDIDFESLRSYPQFQSLIAPAD